MRIALRTTVALAIIFPLLWAFGGGWVTTLAVALIGFGTGRLVEHRVFGPTPAAAPAAGPKAAAFAIGLGLALGVAYKVVEYQWRLSRAEAVEDLQQMLEHDRLQMEDAGAQAEVVWRLRITADGTVLSAGVPTDLDVLVAPPGATRAEVQTDRGVAHERVVALMDRIRGTGIDKIGLDSL